MRNGHGLKGFWQRTAGSRCHAGARKVEESCQPLHCTGRKRVQCLNRTALGLVGRRVPRQQRLNVWALRAGLSQTAHHGDTLTTGKSTIVDLQASLSRRFVPSADGVNLQGFMLDAWYFLGRTEEVATVTLVATRRGVTTLRGAVTLRKRAASISQATNALLRAVNDFVYWDFSAVSVAHAVRFAEISFITVPSGQPYYVSGVIVVHGSHYEKLTRENQMISPQRKSFPAWVAHLPADQMKSTQRRRVQR